MKASQLRELIRELIQGHLDEMSTTGALVQPGGQQIATTKAFTSMRDWKKINKNRKWESLNESFDYTRDSDEVRDLFNRITGESGYDVLDSNMFSRPAGAGLIASEAGEGWMLNIDDTPISDDLRSKFVAAVMKLGEERGWKIIQYGNDAVEIYEKESINESYRKFKKKITNPRQQMNNSVREIEKHLREVDKIIEYNLKLKTEMNVGGGTFYEGTNKRLARISERMNQLNNKLKELGN